ncbi:hypothetical protein AKJ09_07261 [Labilithrix luteola]|uniref:DUF3817 domain-containing protein n=1 Tax=Labilithrix luteola TaxID=1391654 RepID=A0A0K1Q4D6_9BACT|nr:DUF3817 domain-containing protein [Labilithrix luteola]AKV00598.1 hypothetical protein AKJ09_07261 [Labilithrix luteola]
MTVIRQLRLVALLEGLSLGLLVFVGMPLKYALGMPLFVRIMGSVHGILFVTFVATLYRTALEHAWPRRRSLAALGWSFVPFGAFVLDRSLRNEPSAAEAKRD